MLKQKGSYKDKDNNKDNNKDKFNFRKSLLDIGADSNLVDDWLVVRNKKQASNTKTAFELFVSRIDGLNVNDVLKICIERNWSGFNKEWIKKDETKKETTKYNSQTKDEQW
jgi:hypothetical protein